MAGLLGKIGAAIGKLGSLFRRQTKVSIPQTGGERGFAIGHGNRPTDLNRRKLSSQDVEDFVYGGQLLVVNSSNVAAAQFYPKEQKMLVEYLGKKGKGAASYLYSGVTVDEAISFAQAQSKGGWIWSHIRVRGSKTAHRKSYVRVGGRRTVPKKGNPHEEAMYQTMLGDDYQG